MTDEIIITQTKKWITDVVIGCNFCPFAAREVKRGSIHYQVLHAKEKKQVLEALVKAFILLDENPAIETTLLILPSIPDLQPFLDLVELGDELLEKEGYEGTYQLASFHPLYLFAGTTNIDPANYTNRSPYAMLHILREASVSKAIDNYPGTENIPNNNIAFATKKGIEYMQLLKEACMNVPL